jgi:hypothetical protein
MKTRDLRDVGLDLKWTAEAVWTSRRPHTTRRRAWYYDCFTRAVDSALFNVVVVRQHLFFLIRTAPNVPTVAVAAPPALAALWTYARSA